MVSYMCYMFCVQLSFLLDKTTPIFFKEIKTTPNKDALRKHIFSLNILWVQLDNKYENK